MEGGGARGGVPQARLPQADRRRHHDAAGRPPRDRGDGRDRGRLPQAGGRGRGTREAAVSTLRADAIAYPPRGLSREEAARYVGVGPTKFDEMVADRLLPGPKRIGTRIIWDRVALDLAFNALPGEEDGSIEALIEKTRIK